jgi:chromosome partitioning protein
MTVLSIANQKGGVGKTTVAINLGSALAELGKRILLVDLDPQGNATTSLGFNRREVFVSIYEVLIEGFGVRSAIFPTVQENLYILPANENLPGAEIQLVERSGRALVLRRSLGEIRSRYDYILIDCPPSLGILTLNALAGSDGLLIPMQAEFLALEGLSQLMKTVALVRERLNPGLVMAGVVLTMYDSRTRLTREVEAEVRGFFEGTCRVFETVIPRNVRLAEAPSHGLPITRYARTSAGAEAFRSLAREVLDVTEARFGKGLESPDTAVAGGGARRFGTGDAGGGDEVGEGAEYIPDSPESPPAPPGVSGG